MSGKKSRAILSETIGKKVAFGKVAIADEVSDKRGLWKQWEIQ